MITFLCPDRLEMNKTSEKNHFQVGSTDLFTGMSRRTGFFLGRPGWVGEGLWLHDLSSSIVLDGMRGIGA